MTPAESLSGGQRSYSGEEWKGARETMKRVIAAKLQSRGSVEDVEDLAGVASVGLVRAVQRAAIDSLEAMAVTIASRTALDWLRKRDPLRSRPGHGENARDELDGVAAPKVDDDDWSEELVFYLREIIRAAGIKCFELYEYGRVGLNLHTAAGRLGISHAASRKRWQRCMDQARKILRADSGPVGEWARTNLEWS